MDLTEQQLERISYYCENNMAKLRMIAYPIFIKYGGITPKDYDDFYSEANKTVLSAVRIFDNSKGDDFEKFLKGCLSRKFKTLMTRRNRNKRIADRTCVSLDTPIGDENGSTLADMLPSGFDIEEELAEEIGISSDESFDDYSPQMQEYLHKLSNVQRKVLVFLSQGYSPNEIIEILHIDTVLYKDSIAAITSYKNTRLIKKSIGENRYVR